MRKYFAIFLAVVFFSIPYVFSQENITITTYYPSPNGVFETMQLFPTNPAPPPDCNAATEGTMYYDSTTDTVMICNFDNTTNTGNWQTSSSLWALGGTAPDQYIYSKNASWKVGIGTTSPAQTLHVDNANSHSTIRISSPLIGYNSALQLYDRTTKTGWAVLQEGITEAQRGNFGIYRDGAENSCTRQAFVINKDTGNIGIGTATPGSNKLYVNGDRDGSGNPIGNAIYADGDVDINGKIKIKGKEIRGFGGTFTTGDWDHYAEHSYFDAPSGWLYPAKPGADGYPASPAYSEYCEDQNYVCAPFCTRKIPTGEEFWGHCGCPSGYTALFAGTIWEGAPAPGTLPSYWDAIWVCISDQ